MVLSILIATIVAPGLLGSQEAIRQSQSKEKKEEHRARRCNLIATCVKSSPRSREINGRQVVLRNGKLWIDTETEDGSPLGHPYAGYYLPYPDTSYEGLVTTITDVAPIMNWIYIDRETGEAKYGVRTDAQPNLTGPFDCTRQDRRLTFDGWEGWCAVEEAAGLWALYFDLGDDGLKSRVQPGTRVLEIELSRKEKRWKKEGSERMADQTTKRAVDGGEDAPVEKPLAQEAVVERPGIGGEEDAGREREGCRPIKIPKSIVEDPPPVVESLAFRSATPPPAYSPAVEGDAGTVGSAVGRNEAPAEISATGKSDSPPVFGTSPPIVTKSVPAEVLSTVGEEIERSSNEATVPQDQALPTRIDKIDSTPEKADPPSSDEQQSPSPSDKRCTPKLNRSSGSRALVQAQKFEAMAAAQKSDPEARTRSSERGSRANSNTSSVYSNEDASLSAPGTSLQPQVSPTPAPLALAVSKAKQAKALATRSQPPAAPETVSDPSVQRPTTPPRQRAPSVREDPAISEVRTTSNARPIVSLPRRPNPPRSTPDLIPSTSKSPSQQPTQRTTPNRRQRDRSGSELSSPSSSRVVNASRSSTRSSSVTRGRQSLARTMTSGKGNQGMSNRIGGSQGRGSASGVNRQAVGTSTTGKGRERAAMTGARKTTSALFREIDNFVSLEGTGESGKAER
jgi:hypothetical protein